MSHYTGYHLIKLPKKQEQHFLFDYKYVHPLQISTVKYIKSMCLKQDPLSLGYIISILLKDRVTGDTRRH